MPRYVLILGGGQEQTSQYNPEQARQMMQDYDAWSAQLATQPWLRGGGHFNPGGRLISSSDETVEDSPYTGTKDVLIGVVMVEAPDYDAAVEMGKNIPALRHGGWVSVRQLNEIKPDR
jgi:hypothetical protein